MSVFTIKDVKLDGTGCSISQFSASMMTSAIKGKPVKEAMELVEELKAMLDIHSATLEGKEQDEKPQFKLGDLEALKGVVQFPVRIKCATLAWNTLSQAIEEAAN